jgi:transcriptional antiterminator RfaH
MMKNHPQIDWYIVNTKPKQEFHAEKNLKTQGITAYLPVYRKKIKKNREKIEVLTPLFSGYLFARFNIQEFYHRVRYTRGVKTILGNDEYLWSIDNEKIEDIKSREDNGIVVLTRREEFFRKGDRIVIDEGAFEGWEGIFQEELPDRERAIIMLTNIRYTSTLILPKKYLTMNR